MGRIYSRILAVVGKRSLQAGRTLFTALTYAFAAIGAMSLLGALAFAALIFLADQADKRPLKWPSSRQECQASDGRLLTDAELLDLANARWDKDVKSNGEAYSRKYVGGPVIRAGSVVERLNTRPDDSTVYVSKDLDGSADLKMRYRLAGNGVGQYGRVTLALKPPINPDLTVQPKAASMAYDFDLCGARVD